MDNSKPNSNAYLKTRVLTASPEQLQLMLYDGAIRFCEQARVAIEAREIEKSYKLITRAEDIVIELTNGLRDDIDPDTCANMRKLYLFCYERLVDANLKKELSSIDDVIKVLRHLRETWVMLVEKLQQERCGTEAANGNTQTIATNGSGAAPGAVSATTGAGLKGSVSNTGGYGGFSSGYGGNKGSANLPDKQQTALTPVGATINFEG